MIQNCIDALEAFDLPFQTIICTCVQHEEELHVEMEFIWLIEGNVEVVCEKKTYELTSNTVFMIYMKQRHSVRSSPDSLMITFRLKNDYLFEHHLNFDRIPFRNRVYTFEELAIKYNAVPLILSQIILLLNQPVPSPNIRYKIIGYYNMYVYDLYSVRLKERYLDVKKMNYDEYLLRFHTLLEYINHHHHEPITLRCLSSLVGISTFRISHFLRDRLGISFKEYLQHIRFEHALKELKNSSLSIAEIVRNCGFSDAKYLNALMKEKFHITALKYRSIMSRHEVPGFAGLVDPKLINELYRRLHQIDRGIYMHDAFGLKGKDAMPIDEFKGGFI